MRFLFFFTAILLCFASTSYCEDTMNPVFEKIDELVTRVESGISLNSYAETVAQLKFDYKKAQAHATESNNDNPLLSSRMTPIFVVLDDYTQVWRIQETDGYRYMSYDPYIYNNYQGINSCGETIQLHQRSVTRYSISCIKSKILDKIYPLIDKAKCAHVNGW